MVEELTPFLSKGLYVDKQQADYDTIKFNEGFPA